MYQPAIIARNSELSDTLPGVDKRYLISQILQPLSAGSVQSSPHACQPVLFLIKHSVRQQFDSQHARHALTLPFQLKREGHDRAFKSLLGYAAKWPPMRRPRPDWTEVRSVITRSLEA